MLAANGNLVPPASTLGTNTVDTQSTRSVETPADDLIQSPLPAALVGLEEQTA